MLENEPPLTPKVNAGYNAVHSRLVQRLRLILPLIALVIAAIVFSWGFIDSDKLTPPPQTDTQKKPAQSALIAPNFQSIDEKGRPFSITAKEAIQDKTNADLVYLNQPQATLQVEDTQTLSLSALKGAYEQNTKRLRLKDDIVLSDNDKFTVQASELGIDFEHGIAKSSTHVTGKSGPNTLDSQNGLMVDSQNNIIILIGPARVTLHTEDSNILF